MWLERKSEAVLDTNIITFNTTKIIEYVKSFIPYPVLLLADVWTFSGK